MTINEETERKLMDLLNADGFRVAEVALQIAGKSPDIALMLLGGAVNAVIQGAPEDQRLILLRRFLSSFGIVKEVEQ